MTTRISAPTGFLAVGGIGVVAGGLVAAATGPLRLSLGSWVAAFLVLVVGVAQIGLGALQEGLAARPASDALVAGELVAWNGGAAAVIAGTLLDAPPLVDVGGVLMVLALVLVLLGVRGSSGSPHWAVWVFRALVAVLLVSVPIGLVLAQLRAG